MPRLDRPPVEPKDYSPDDVSKLVVSLPSHAQPLVAFIAEIGCRPSEAINLDWGEVMLDDGVCVLHQHKTAGATGKTRKLWLTPAALDILRDIEVTIAGDITGPVFLSRLGRPYTRRGLRRIVDRHAKALGLHVTTLYGLRHSRAQSILENGGNLEMVASQLGHASIVMSQRYAQIRDAQARQIASNLVSLTQPKPDAGSPKRAPSKASHPTKRRWRTPAPAKRRTG